MRYQIMLALSVVSILTLISCSNPTSSDDDSGDTETPVTLTGSIEIISLDPAGPYNAGDDVTVNIRYSLVGESGQAKLYVGYGNRTDMTSRTREAYSSIINAPKDNVDVSVVIQDIPAMLDLGSLGTYVVNILTVSLQPHPIESGTVYTPYDGELKDIVVNP